MPPYYVMLDEKSVDEAQTLEEARTKAQAIYDQEPIPCTCWISDAEGNHVEEVKKSDGRDLSAQMRDFNKSFGKGKD